MVPKITIQHELHEISLKRGETLTVWLPIGNSNVRAQVELRSFGKRPEVFVRDERDLCPRLLPFSKWYSLKEDAK